MATMIFPGIRAIVHYTPEFRPGDPEPEGYIDRQEWARVQMKAGLRQTQCPDCSRWKFPQQLSTQEVRWTGRDRRGREHALSAFRCLDCAEVMP
jgi:NMD protein affecting ribosome stability and mRNA decay